MVSLLDYFRSPSPTVESTTKDLVDPGGLPLANNPNQPLVGSSISTGLWGGYGMSATGQPVTPWSAVTSSAVWTCVRVLSEDLAKLPIQILRRLPNGGWVVDEQHRLNRLFETPNDWHNAFDSICYMGVNLALRGNSHAVILRDGAGVPVQMVPLSPDRVSILIVQSTGEILYWVSHQTISNDQGFIVSRDDMVHVRGISLNGYTGISPIAANANSIGLSLALSEHGATVFRNGASIGGIVKLHGVISDQALDRVQQSLDNRHVGISNSGRMMVIGADADFSPTMMTAQESQFLEARKASNIEIAGMFRTPPHKLGLLEESHYNNLESQNQAFIDDTLSPIARRMEQEFERVMLFNSERGTIRIRFDFDEMLRGDQATRFGVYAVGLTNGIYNRNEVRSREGLPPVSGGDQFMTPLNMGNPDSPAPPKPVETVPSDK